MKRKRVWTWSIAFALLILVIVFAVPWYAEYRVKEMIAPYLTGTESVGISIDLLAGDIVFNNADVLVNAEPAKHIPKIKGYVDTLSISGISVYQLLFKRTIDVDQVLLRARDIQLVIDRSDTLLVDKSQKPKKKKDRTVRIGKFDLRTAALSGDLYAKDTAHISMDSLSVKGSAFTLDPSAADHGLDFLNSSIAMSKLEMEWSSGYALHLGRASVEKNGAMALFTDISYAPTIDLEKFATTLDHERDAFDLKFDSVAISGFDPQELIATRAVHAGEVRCVNADIIVMRDKTLRDGPQPYRPLLGKLIRKLPPGSGVDSIVLTNLSATYHERADRGRGFANIPFTELNAVITGVLNSTEAQEPMVVDAKCNVFGKTPVTMHLTTDLQDSTDRFVVDAQMGHLYFPVLNKASSPLLDVKATAGDLQSLVFHMEADDRKANGTVAMRYEGIKLTGGRIEKDRTISKLLSAVINALIRNDSKGAKGIDRVGTFAIERRRDRAIFNYLWTGLKEGSKGMLLPKLLTK